MTVRSRRLRPWHVDALGSTAVVLLSALACLAVVRPFMAARREHIATEAGFASSLQQQADLSQKEADLRRRIENAESALSTGRLQLESGDFLNNRVAHIVELASASGIDIHTIRPEAAVAGAQFERVPIRISGKGSYPLCAAFLHRMHESLPDTGVVGLNLSGHPGVGTPASFRFDLIWYAAPGAQRQ